MGRRILAFPWYWADGVFLSTFLSLHIFKNRQGGSHQGAFLCFFENQQGDDCTIWEFFFFGLT